MSIFYVLSACVLGAVIGTVLAASVSFIIKHKRMSKSKKHDQKSIINRIGTMNLILIIVGISLLVFTVTMIVIFIKCGAIPDTLVTCVYATLGGECGIMGWIKTNKDRHQEREWEKEDRLLYDEGCDKQ